MTFTLPGEISPRIVESTPAQVSPGDTLIIEGSGFTEGVLQLRIYNSRFEENIVVPNWLPDPKATEITATVDTTARLERNGNIVEVLPGIYTAQVLLTKTFAIPGGGNKEFVQSSNQFPFMVTPVVSSSSLSGDILTIQGAGFQVMTDPIIEKEEMEVYAGMHQFHRSMTTLGADPGQFRVISTTEIELRLPVNMETGTQPIRVIVAGAESKPSWANI